MLPEASAEDPDASGSGPTNSNEPSAPGPFPSRSVAAAGISRSGRPWEIETTREHVRIVLENWEKQSIDVIRYERAKERDDSDIAGYRRALTRSGASSALAVSAIVPVWTNPGELAQIGAGPTNVGTALVMLGGPSAATGVASLWWAGRLFAQHRRFTRARTRPALPPRRLDAHEVLSIIERNTPVPYYREHDADVEADLGWRTALPPPLDFPDRDA